MTEPTPRRQRRKNLTDNQLAELKRDKHKRYTKADPEMRGHHIRVPTAGPCVFYAVARDPYGKQVWTKIGTADVLKVKQSRERARAVIRRIEDGLPAFEPVPVRPETYVAVAKKWLAMHVSKEGLRSQTEIDRLLRKHVFPFWGKRDFISIKRRDINDLLDSIAKRSAWNADHVLAIIRKIANWYATRDDDYVSPFVTGMRRTRSEKRERDRFLNDEEMRSIWKAAEAGGQFGALVQVLLLTAQRRGAVVRMKWLDFKPDDGVWEIATEEREKGNAGALKLPDQALAIIQAQPRLTSNHYVFAAARGGGPLNGFNKRKAAFDKACGITGWTLHDLRRTARSLMSRAGVGDEHAERALGHKLQGVRRVYDRYDYFEEKSEALAKLAALIETIINPPADDNVVPFVAASGQL